MYSRLSLLRSATGLVIFDLICGLTWLVRVHYMMNLLQRNYQTLTWIVVWPYYREVVIARVYCTGFPAFHENKIPRVFPEFSLSKSGNSRRYFRHMKCSELVASTQFTVEVSDWTVEQWSSFSLASNSLSFPWYFQFLSNSLTFPCLE